MVDLLIILFIAIPIIYGALTAGTPKQRQIHSANTDSNHTIDPSMELQHFSNLGYRLCFDQNILFNRPDLINQLPRTTKVGISEFITQTLKQHGKSSQYAFLTKSILSSMQEFEDLKICKAESDNSLNNSRSLSDINDRTIVESYLTDQTENLYYNLFVTDSKDMWSNANSHGLKSILITEK
ncbi:MAG: hypothetical protein ACE3L7_32305 [Candidatus Pristimantibacillus sp.]